MYTFDGERVEIKLFFRNSLKHLLHYCKFVLLNVYTMSIQYLYNKSNDAVILLNILQILNSYIFIKEVNAGLYTYFWHSFCLFYLLLFGRRCTIT